MRGKTAFVLVLLALAVMTTASAAQSPETRSVGGFTAQVPPAPTQKAPKPEEPQLPEGWRRIPAKLWVPITEQLLPTDRVLELVTGVSLHQEGEYDADQEIENLTFQSAAAAIVRVTGKQSQLIPAGTWVNSTITAQVQTVLKDDTGQLSVDGTMTFPEYGGEIVLDGRRIIARHGLIAPIREQGRYLIFFRLLKDWTLQPTSYASTFELDGSTIKRLRTDGDEKGWGIERKTPEWATGRVREKTRFQQEMRRKPQ